MNYRLRNLPHRLRGWKAEVLTKAKLGLCSELRARKFRYRFTPKNGLLIPGQLELVEDLGVLGRRVVTDAGVNFLADAFQNLTEIENMNWHGSGTSGAAEAVGDTALGVEVESRVSGTQGEGASANIYQTVATINYTGTHGIVEHGLFSASTAGTLWDRTVFSVINVVNGDAIEFTYEVTINSGG